MKNESFNEEIQDVLNFIEGEKYLFGKVPPEYLEVMVVEKVPPDWLNLGSNGKPYWDLKKDELTYGEIRSEEQSIIDKIRNENKDIKEITGKLRRLLKGQQRLYNEVVEAINGFEGAVEVAAEVIVDDLLVSSFWRASFGKKQGFWETVFQIYKSGGMPVGWSGKYPQGRLMAIYPGLKTRRPAGR